MFKLRLMQTGMPEDRIEALLQEQNEKISDSDGDLENTWEEEEEEELQDKNGNPLPSSTRTVRRVKDSLGLTMKRVRMTANKADEIRGTKATEGYLRPHFELLKETYEKYTICPENL